MEIIQHVDLALRRYYESVGRTDYMNSDGIGKFMKFVKVNEMDKNITDDTLKRSLNCFITEFDEDFSFNGDVSSKQRFIFDLIAKCNQNHDTLQYSYHDNYIFSDKTLYNKYDAQIIGFINSYCTINTQNKLSFIPEVLLCIIYYYLAGTDVFMLTKMYTQPKPEVVIQFRFKKNIESLFQFAVGYKPCVLGSKQTERYMTWTKVKRLLQLIGITINFSFLQAFDIADKLELDTLIRYLCSTSVTTHIENQLSWQLLLKILQTLEDIRKSQLRYIDFDDFAEEFGLDNNEIRMLWDAVYINNSTQNKKNQTIKINDLFAFIQKRLEIANIFILIKDSLELFRNKQQLMKVNNPYVVDESDKLILIPVPNHVLYDIDSSDSDLTLTTISEEEEEKKEPRLFTDNLINHNAIYTVGQYKSTLEKRIMNRRSMNELENSGLVPMDYFNDPQTAMAMKHNHWKLIKERLEKRLMDRPSKQELIAIGTIKLDDVDIDMNEEKTNNMTQNEVSSDKAESQNIHHSNDLNDIVCIESKSVLISLSDEICEIDNNNDNIQQENTDILDTTIPGIVVMEELKETDIIENKCIDRQLVEEDLKRRLKNRSTKQELIARGLTRLEYFDLDIDDAKNAIKQQANSTKRQVEQQLNAIFNPQLIELEAFGNYEMSNFLSRPREIEQGHRRILSVTYELQQRLLHNPMYNEELARTLVHDLMSDSSSTSDENEEIDELMKTLISTIHQNRWWY